MSYALGRGTAAGKAFGRTEEWPLRRGGMSGVDAMEGGEAFNISITVMSCVAFNALPPICYVFIVMDTRALFCVVCSCPTSSLNRVNAAHVRAPARGT